MAERYEQGADFGGGGRATCSNCTNATTALVWTTVFPTIEAARTIFEVMQARPERWAAWIRLAEILGADFVAGLVEAEALSAAEQQARTAMA